MASRSIVRLAVRDRPHLGSALGERAELVVLLRPVETQRQLKGNSWPRAHGVEAAPQQLRGSTSHVSAVNGLACEFVVLHIMCDVAVPRLVR